MKKLQKLSGIGVYNMTVDNKLIKQNNKDFKWLIIYTSSRQFEHDFYVEKVEPFLKKLDNKTVKNVSVDLIYIGKRHTSKEFIENKIVKIRSTKPYFREKIITEEKSLSDLMLMFKKEYNGIVISSHSNGVIIGTEKNPVPEIEIVEFIKLYRKNISTKKLTFFVGDCCYMGSIETLYELSDIAKYILATPSYHDGNYSFVQCPNLYIKHNDKIVWLSSLPNWYLAVAERYAARLDFPIQWTIFVGSAIAKLGKYILTENLAKHFVFTKKSIIYHDDSDLHNFSMVIENTMKEHKYLKNKLNKLLLLFIKSFVYYAHNEKCQCKLTITPMSIHSKLPNMDKIKQEFACKLDLFKEPHCVEELKAKVESPIIPH